MAGRHWFIHIQGETFGPLSNEIVVLMIKQNRLQFSDFIWSEGCTKWMRIVEISEFTALMPPYPKVPVPAHAGVKAARGENGDAAKGQGQKRVRVRRHPRALFEAKLSTVNFGSFETHNVSEGGVYVKSERLLLPIGTTLNFRLESPSLPSTFELSGVVVRLGTAHDPPGFGIEFTKITEEQRRQIRAYVEGKLGYLSTG
jgi:hypothetical protein